jgi:hypothetical protein
MNCPEQIAVNSTNITEPKCKENLAFWKNQLSDTIEDELVIKNKNLSMDVLPAHTTRYEYLKTTFGYIEKNN